jgi:hypothetical protein
MGEEDVVQWLGRKSGNADSRGREDPTLESGPIWGVGALRHDL